MTQFLQHFCHRETSRSETKRNSQNFEDIDLNFIMWLLKDL